MIIAAVIFAVLAVIFYAISRPTPGGVNNNAILILPAYVCGAIAIVCLAIKLLGAV